MFVDRTRIRVTGGAGGNGCSSFRREKYVPRGGPDGGDGGHGGAIYFVANSRLNSLQPLRYHHHWRGNSAEHGRGKNCHGRDGEPIRIDVPPGTLIRDFDTGDIRCDLSKEGQEYLAAAGGKGGKGNARFKTSTQKAPRFAELGEPGQVFEFLLELKLIAEIGLVGLPNAGKSTFLSSVTEARPKIADYPFTTLSPNLGVVPLSGYRTMTIADIPGIIEGAAQGKGLGHEFLRHIERTKVLLFIIDLGDPDPLQTLETLESELAQHSTVFAKRPRIIALNKGDMPENTETFESVRTQFKSPYRISALTGDGVSELMEHTWTIVEQARQGIDEEEAPTEDVEYTFTPPYTIEQAADGFHIEGASVLRAVRMTDFNNEEAIRYLHHRLRKMGLLQALKRMGAEQGASIHIGDVELEYNAE